jgi:hypothetical protein
MKLHGRLLFVLIVVVNATSCCRVPTEPHGLSLAPKPTWTIDLRSHGYASDPYKVHSQSRAMRQIAFSRRDELVIVNDLGVCGKSNPVHAFVLDSGSGTVLNETKWTSNCWPYIFATAQGNYAAVTADGITVYSPGLKKVLASAPQAAAEVASPDGRTLAAWKQIPRHGLTYLLDADTLQPTGHEFLDRNVASVSADAIAYLATNSGSPNEIVFLDDGKSKLSAIATECGLAHARFLTASELVVLGCNRLTVSNIQGSELFSESGTGYVGSTEVGGSSLDGRRFALIREFDDSGDPAHICIERITVFDVATRKPIFAVDLRELKGSYAHAHASGIALSPDGSLLAVDSEGMVQVFEMPKKLQD